MTANIELMISFLSKFADFSFFIGSFYLLEFLF